MILKRAKSKVIALGMLVAGFSVYFTSKWFDKFKKQIDIDIDITNEDIENNLGI